MPTFPDSHVSHCLALCRL
ncbi:uncharacterized protein FTOL_13981 [Fusarium torulosum]|uniref:Uncharacterized protein n=1 Tax=Fusarium torulosum TaxID=33205 RepID=A0AAE8SQR0_9HYPO|nr:uncharacterized protein FTOL_13981 [Fusarium torulosum]